MKKIITLILFLSFLMSATGRATSVRTVNLLEMVALSDRIFWGRCLGAEGKIEESSGLPIAEYAFEVREGVKGVQSGQKIVFRQVRTGRVGGIPGIPHYRKGQELLLFLHGDSDLGLTSPVGLGQGTFQLRKTPNHELGVVNLLGNRNLSYRLAIDQVQASGMTPSDLEQIQKGEPIPLPIFSSLVQKIDRYHARESRPLR